MMHDSEEFLHQHLEQTLIASSLTILCPPWLSSRCSPPSCRQPSCRPEKSSHPQTADKPGTTEHSWKL